MGNIGTGGAFYPPAGQVAIVTLLSPLNYHRVGEIYRAIKICLDAARDNNFYFADITSSADAYVITTLDGGKDNLRIGTAPTDLITEDVGIMFAAATRAIGANNIMDNAHLQLLEWMRENGRLAA